MKRIIILLLFALLLASCGQTNEDQPITETATAPTNTPDGFDRQAMLENITMQVILPAHEKYVRRLAELETAVKAFNADPTSESLTAVQESWLAANLARMALLPFRIGPVDDSLLHHRMDNRPPRIAFIDEDILAGTEPITSDYLDSIGSSSVGLGVMEYLLFNPVDGNSAVLQTFTSGENADRRGQLLVTLAENLHQKGSELEQIWSADGENYARAFIEADMDGGELQGSMNMLANQMIAEVEEITGTRLGKPSGQRSNGMVRPDLVEAPYSQDSLPRIIATVEGLQAAFNGGDGLGFDDYLDFLGARYEDESLSAAINVRFTASLDALKAIDSPLDTAVEDSPDQVNAAIESLNDLLVLLKADMVNALGITLTFSDNDGD